MSSQLLLGGRIHAHGDPEATAMLVEDGVITWIGQDTPGRAMAPAGSRHIPLDGAWVSPAFVDCHVHATATGLQLQALDLSAVSSLAELLQLLRRAAADEAGFGRHGLLWGHGWDETGWPENRPPSRAELDEAVGSRPVYLSRVDVHSAAVSSGMLLLAPHARDATGYHPQQPVSLQAHHHLRGAALEQFTSADIDRLQRAFLQHVAARGVACVHECAGPEISGTGDLRSLLGLAEDPGRVEVVGYWGELVDDPAAAKERAVELGVAGLGGDLFVDGSLGSRTAALLHPYADDPHTSGTLQLDAGQIAGHLSACTAAGLQAGFHVIGDAGTAEVLAGMELLAAELPTSRIAAAQHRLEHLESVSETQLQRLAQLGVLASVQPGFDQLWGGESGMYARRLGQQRAAALNPFSGFSAAGVGIGLGSDSPVCAVRPWEWVRAASQHRTPGSRMSARGAFTAATRGGWRLGGRPDAGMLRPGMPASYAVWEAGELQVGTPDSRIGRWSTDPRSGVPGLPMLPSEESSEPLPRCLATVHRGEVLYGAGH